MSERNSATREFGGITSLILESTTLIKIFVTVTEFARYLAEST